MPMPSGSRSCSLSAATCAALLLLGACSTARVQSLDGRAYPGSVVQERVLDVQLIQRPQAVSLTNTTPRTLGPGWLWINGWYSAALPAVGIGERIEIPMRDFRNEFGESPRSGGFWAGRDATRVVHAQIETTDPESGASTFLGLVVVGQGVR
jgi:hypothetical protein